MTTPPVGSAEVRAFAVTIPAATTVDAPYTESIAFPPRTLQAVTWFVPPGASGLSGWRLTMSNGNQVIPTGGGWIIADSVWDTWPVINQPDSGQWEVTGYNTDQYDHTVYLYMHLGLIVPAVAPAAPIPATLLAPPSGAAAVTSPPAVAP